ncbi:MAG: glycerol-3-phosphate cytidylyltransferase [bacterium]|nr:glycerol-3-phosphate cytidylyltransferase [bacterium]
MKRILTYGTYDLLHYGHIRLLKRAKALGDYLIVALSTDEFNEIKGKKAYHSYEERKEMLEAIRYVDLVIPEDNWEQKISDVEKYHADVVVMGSDWAGSDKFDYLSDYCEVLYLDRTEGVSTTKIKEDLRLNEPNKDEKILPEPQN